MTSMSKVRSRANSTKVLENFYGKATAFVLYEKENENAKRYVKKEILPMVEKCKWEARDAFCPGASTEANLEYITQNDFIVLAVICSAFAANDLLSKRFQQIQSRIEEIRLIPIVLNTRVPDTIQYVSCIVLSGRRKDDADELERLEKGLRAQLEPEASTIRRKRRRRRRRKRRLGVDTRYKLRLFQTQLKFATTITRFLPLYYGLFLMQFLASFVFLIFDLVRSDGKTKPMTNVLSSFFLLLLRTVVGCVVPTKLRQCSKNIGEHLDAYSENLTEDDLKSVESFMREQELTSLQPCDNPTARRYDCLYEQLNTYLISTDAFFVCTPFLHYSLMVLQLYLLGYFDWDGTLPFSESGYFSYMRIVFWIVFLVEAVSFFSLLFCSHLWASLCFHSSAKVAIDINNALRAGVHSDDVPNGRLAVVACNLDGSLKTVFRNFKYILGAFAVVQFLLLVSLFPRNSEITENQKVASLFFLIMLAFSELCLCCTTRKWKSIGILADFLLVAFAGILRYTQEQRLVFPRIFDFLEFGLLRLLFFSVLICQIVRNVHLKKGPIRQENLKEIGCIVGLMLLLSPEVFYMRLFF